jgi:hypothetical protein
MDRAARAAAVAGGGRGEQLNSGVTSCAPLLRLLPALLLVLSLHSILLSATPTGDDAWPLAICFFAPDRPIDPVGIKSKPLKTGSSRYILASVPHSPCIVPSWECEERIPEDEGDDCPVQIQQYGHTSICPGVQQTGGLLLLE